MLTSTKMEDDLKKNKNGIRPNKRRKKEKKEDNHKKN